MKSASTVLLLVVMCVLHMACEAETKRKEATPTDDKNKTIANADTAPPRTTPKHYPDVQRATSHCLSRVYDEYPMTFYVKGVCALMSCLVTYNDKVKLANVNAQSCPRVKVPCKQSMDTKLKRYPKCCPRECSGDDSTKNH